MHAHAVRAPVTEGPRGDPVGARVFVELQVTPAQRSAIGIIGFDGQIEVEALRLFGLPEAAPAVFHACPSVPMGTREFQAEVSWDLPSLARGATALTDVTVTESRQGDAAQASLVSSTRFIDLTAFAWTNTTVRVMARDISGARFDLAAATLSARVVKRRIR
ncbi:hypothetical protein [Roseomonas rosulenta]|uniref:hypothetical protein n=1 Tax=Roseomonas rosulenta TaxID=2748667 RepID=UPI0018DF6094|nr:hypothetical protein [Roseomonas rosulenta]